MINNTISVFDCTLREVGYQTGWHFDVEFCRAYYQFAQARHVDYLELGFFHNVEADPDRGVFRYCATENEKVCDIFNPVKNYTKLSAMRDIQRPMTELLPQKETCIDAIRILTRSHETDLTILAGEVNLCRELGYEVFVNFTSAGHNTLEQNKEFAKFARDEDLGTIYFADTESIFLPDYVINTLDICNDFGVNAGMHLHDKNGTAQMLLEVALNKGCNFIDATLLGFGGKWHDGNLTIEHVLQRFGIQGGYELTKMKTALVQQLIKYNEKTAAVL